MIQMDVIGRLAPQHQLGQHGNRQQAIAVDIDQVGMAQQRYMAQERTAAVPGKAEDVRNALFPLGKTALRDINDLHPQHPQFVRTRPLGNQHRGLEAGVQRSAHKLQQHLLPAAETSILFKKDNMFHAVLFCITMYSDGLWSSYPAYHRAAPL